MPIVFRADGDGKVVKNYCMELQRTNPGMIKILQAVDQYVTTKYAKNLQVTEVYRSAEENKAIYGKPKKTAHTVWAAVDVSSGEFDGDQIRDIVSFIRDNFDGTNSNPMRGHGSALYHSVGKGYHIHIQWAPKRKQVAN